MVFEQSSRYTDLFLLIEGRVSVEITNAAADAEDRLELTVLRAGEVFGEIAFLENTRRSACVRALDQVTALRIEGTRLQALLDENPRLGYRLMRNLAAILARRVVDVNFKWRRERGALGMGLA